MAFILIFTFTPYEYLKVDATPIWLNFWQLGVGTIIEVGSRTISISGQAGTIAAFIFLELGILGFSLTLKRAISSIRERTYDVIFIIMAIMSAIFLIIGAITLFSFSSNGVPYFYIAQGSLGLLAFMYILIEALVTRY